jgi:hypothetical protein
VLAQFERPISPKTAAAVLRATPDVVVEEGPADFHTPLQAAGKGKQNNLNINKATDLNT